MDRSYPTYRLGPDFRARLARFRERFLLEGFDEFAAEFANLDQFICRAWSEDSPEKEIRRTPKEEYLLEALSFSVLDELHRDAFNKAKHTLIILPDCLTLHNPACEKVESRFGDTCIQCEKSCQSYHVTDLANRYGAYVAFSKRDLSSQLEHYKEELADFGVIGVACIVMLASGMRTAAEMGIPARGVLLSFTGCEHWNDSPFTSAFPISWLNAILEEKRVAQGG